MRIADSGHLLLPNGDLVIISVAKPENEGEYSCKVKNLLTGQISQSQGLKVHVRGKSGSLFFCPPRPPHPP